MTDLLDPDRLLPVDPATRDIARGLYESVAELPIISPHGHVAPSLLADDEPFADPTSLFVTHDHYVTRLLHAAGIDLGSLGVGVRPPTRARRGASCARTGTCSSEPRPGTGSPTSS
jgi:glucuronate isomerase